MDSQGHQSDPYAGSSNNQRDLQLPRNVDRQLPVSLAPQAPLQITGGNVGSPLSFDLPSLPVPKA